MRVVLKLNECSPVREAGLGATLAEQHMASVHKGIAENALRSGILVVLDFAGMAAVNGSYIKGTALWLLKCGQLSAANTDTTIAPRHQADPRPFDVFVCVTGLSVDVKIEFQEFFKPRGLPLLFAPSLKRGNVKEAVILGHLDPVLKLTINAVAAQGACTAPELHSLYPDQNVTVTAWNNRLNELHSLRLVKRTRFGRVLKYESLTEKILWE